MTDALEASRKAPTVLIADDDPSVVKFLADRCASIGFEPQTATNGLQALIMARRNPPDVMIVDVNMPELDGLSLCVRLLGAGTKGIEVIVVTGNSSPETIERCESFGAIYARKGPDLWDTVRSALTEIFPGMVSGLPDLRRAKFRVQVRARPLVLVVDDDPDVGPFLEGRLRKCGVDTHLAPNGIRGYQIACREKPNAIISDYFMPDGDITYLLWRLRSTPTTENIPVFAMSGRHLDERNEADLKKEVCGRPGALRFFKKPFDIHELFVALQGVCALEYGPTGSDRPAT
jgi:CheY-like chemotaxis protein